MSGLSEQPGHSPGCLLAQTPTPPVGRRCSSPTLLLCSVWLIRGPPLGCLPDCFSGVQERLALWLFHQCPDRPAALSAVWDVHNFRKGDPTSWLCFGEMGESDKELVGWGCGGGRGGGLSVLCNFSFWERVHCVRLGRSGLRAAGQVVAGHTAVG